MNKGKQKKKDSSDYYDLLEISKDASEDEIKKAYKKMAVKWHPDKNNNSAESNKKFKEIAEAYEILSDPVKKSNYDLYGKDFFDLPSGNNEHQNNFSRNFNGFPNGGMKMPFNFSGFPGNGYNFKDPFDMFHMFMGGNSFGSNNFNSNPSNFSRNFHSNGNDNNGNMVDSSDVSDSSSDSDALPKNNTFKKSNRTNKTNKFDKTYKTDKSAKQKGPDTKYDLKCSLEELFNGTVKKIKISREVYNKSEREQEVIEINVEPGWKEDTKITYANKGDNVSSNIEPGDIIFTIKEKPHDKFKRIKNDLQIIIPTTLKQVLKGFSTKITYIGDIKETEINIPSFTESQYTHIIKGKGMPIRKSGQGVIGYGDLLINFNIDLKK